MEANPLVRSSSYRAAVRATTVHLGNDTTPSMGFGYQEQEGTVASPYDTASWAQRLSYGYVLPLMKTGAKRPLQLKDLSRLSRHDTPTR